MRFGRRQEDKEASADLVALAGTPTWMYEWEVAPGVRTGLLHPELTSVHETRAAIMEPVVREALAAAGPNATAVDLACSEGWFAHRLLEWGAARAVGIDVRPEDVERAELIRDHYGIDPERLRFQVSDVYDVTGSYDIVLCLGLIYHLENPIGALRVARSLTKRLCVVESQLTEQNEPLRHGWGVTGQFQEQPASWAAWYEPQELQEGHPIASHGGIVSFIPNRAGLVDGLRAAGFAQVEPLGTERGNQQYVGGHRLVVAARPAS